MSGAVKTLVTGGALAPCIRGTDSNGYSRSDAGNLALPRRRDRDDNAHRSLRRRYAASSAQPAAPANRPFHIDRMRAAAVRGEASDRIRAAARVPPIANGVWPARVLRNHQQAITGSAPCRATRWHGNRTAVIAAPAELTRPAAQQPQKCPPRWSVSQTPVQVARRSGSVTKGK